MRVVWLGRLLGIAAGAWFALLACMPMSTTPVPGSMVDQNNSFQFDVSQTVGDTVGGSYSPSGVGLSGQISYVHRFSKLGLHVGGTVFGGQPQIVGAGTYFGGMWGPGNVQVGFQIAGGWLWGEVGVPLRVRAGELVWFYTMPSVGARQWVVRVPVGVGFRVAKHAEVHVEGAGLYYSPDYPSALGGTLSTGVGFTF